MPGFRGKRYKKHGNNQKAAHLSKPMRKAVKTIINRNVQKPEEKAVARTIPSISFIDTSAGDFVDILSVAYGPGLDYSIGAGPNQRIGTEIWVKKVEFSWSDFIPTLMYGSSYRVILFVDNDGFQSTPTMFAQGEGFFNGAPAAGLSIYSHYNRDTIGPNKRYSVLHDQIYYNHLPAAVASSADTQLKVRRISHTFPFKGMKVLCTPSDAAATVGMVAKNAIYAWFVAAGTTNAVASMELRVNELRSCVYYTDA